MASLRTGKPRIARLSLAILLLLSGVPAIAASPMQATSSRAAREDAIRSLPLDHLDPDDQERVRSTINTTSIFRRLPVQITECDPDLYLFLVRHPDVVVSIWEVMKISNVALERTGPRTFRASDGVGTLCQVKYCYSGSDTQVIYAEGSYDGPLLSRPVKARCVLVLKSAHIEDPPGKHFMSSRMDTFISIENAGVDLLAKTLQPLMNRSADYNFSETASFLGALSKATENNPAGVNRLAGRLNGLEPEVRDRFAGLVLEVGQRARQRGAVQATANKPLNPTIHRPGNPDRR